MAIHVPIIGGLLGGWAARRGIAGIVTGIFWLFRTRMGLFIVTAMAWLGVNLGTMKMVIEPSLDVLYNYASAGGSGEYAATAMMWMGVMNLDRAITMIGSALLFKKGLTAGRLFLFKRGYGAKP